MWKKTILRASFTLITTAGIGLVAYASHQPFLFPSLGPTAFLLFYKPQAIISSPRNSILGHLIGIFSGFLGLAAFGLIGTSSAFETGVSLQYIGAATIALTLTAALMNWWRVEHPPAGATTLIISLGIMNTYFEIAIMFASIVGLCVIGWLLNNLSGTKYPKWKPLASAKTYLK